MCFVLKLLCKRPRNALQTDLFVFVFLCTVGRTDSGIERMQLCTALSLLEGLSISFQIFN